jgi:hypothetical protein
LRLPLFGPGGAIFLQQEQGAGSALQAVCHSLAAPGWHHFSHIASVQTGNGSRSRTLTLIKELTFTCGYGSASLRERLYCNLEDATQPMNSFMIYTASGDSEGTLGGLVAQASPGRFERLVEEAADDFLGTPAVTGLGLQREDYVLSDWGDGEGNRHDSLCMDGSGPSCGHGGPSVRSRRHHPARF